MSSTFSTDHIDIVVLARSFRVIELESHLSKTYQLERFRDALHVRLTKGDVYIFDYGVMVAWGVNAAKKQSICSELKEYADQQAELLDWDHYKFVIDSQKLPGISNDRASLLNDDRLTLLAFSHAFAQSAKLEIFEQLAQKSITDNIFLANVLAETGKIPRNRNQLSKLRGGLFQTKSDILLHFNLLDTPEFFWNYPDYEASYLLLIKYLDMKPRIELLSLKLETIRELLEMLATEQNHKHSSFLEWIIILLISVEIALYFTN